MSKELDVSMEFNAQLGSQESITEKLSFKDNHLIISIKNNQEAQVNTQELLAILNQSILKVIKADANSSARSWEPTFLLNILLQ